LVGDFLVVILLSYMLRIIVITDQYDSGFGDLQRARNIFLILYYLLIPTEKGGIFFNLTRIISTLFVVQRFVKERGVCC